MTEDNKKLLLSNISSDQPKLIYNSNLKVNSGIPQKK